MTGECKPASFATSIKCALKGRPDGAGFCCDAMPRDAIPLSWLKICSAEAQRDRRTKERRLILMNDDLNAFVKLVALHLSKVNLTDAFCR